MVVAGVGMRIHAAVVQQEAHMEKVLASRRYCCMGLWLVAFIGQ